MNVSIALRCTLLGALIAASCSVLNSFDAVGDFQPDAGPGQGGAGGGDAGSAGSGGSNSTAGDGGSAGGGSSGEGGTGATGGSSGGSGGEAGTPDAPPGLVVVAGPDYDSGATPNERTQLLLALSPQTGEELARESLDEGAFTVVGYDGVRDLWYLFKNTANKNYGFSVNDVSTLEIRQFDRLSDTWETLTTAPFPLEAPPAAGSLAILRDRVAYIGQVPNDAGPAPKVLVVLDTSDPANPQEMVDSPLTIPEGPRGLNAWLGSGVGGVVNIAYQPPCDMIAGICELHFHKVSVDNGISLDAVAAKVTEHASANGANAVWTANILDGLDVVVNRVPGAIFGEVKQLTPIGHVAAGMAKTFQPNAVVFGGVAFDSCNAIAFPIEALPPASLYAVPIPASATVGSQSLLATQQGQIVLFEPYTRSVLTPFDAAGNFGFPAYAVQGTSMAPTFSRRQANWMPPADIQVRAAAVAQPNPPICQ